MTKWYLKKGFKLTTQSNPTSEIRNGFERFAYNPFLEADIPIRPKREFFESKNRDLQVIREGSGNEVAEVTHMTSYYKVDAQKFVKIYQAGIDLIYELSGSGKKVFRHVYGQIQENIGKDKIHMSFQSTTGISQATYTRGVKELVEKKMLAPVLNQPTLWWINPNFIFNGDRLKITTVYEKVDNDSGEIYVD